MAWVLKNADIIAALPILADHYEKADYDTDEDGTIEEAEKKQSNQVVLTK